MRAPRNIAGLPRVHALMRALATELWPIRRASAPRALACLLLGGIAGYLLVPAPPAAEATRPPEVTLGGKPLPLEGGAGATLDAARAVARAWSGGKVALTAASATTETTREAIGARVDPQRLASLVAQIHDPRSALRRAAKKNGRPVALPLPVSVDAPRALTALLALKDELDRAPANARLDVSARKVVPDEPGVRVDVYATLARLERALADAADETTVEIVSESVPAARSAAQIEEVRELVAQGEVLGYFETKYARDMKHEARTFNLRRAASKLDGHVLMPGEMFDFNEVVGPRNEANGYKVAPVIAQGELVDGIGGGTCQIAGTLHGAAFFAGLDIVERRPHTRPSFYIKMGLDAAVAYPTITLRLRNPFSHPVVLHETVENGFVRAEILGPKRTRDVTFVRKMNDVTPFAEKEIPDPKIPKGERVLSQRGIPGFRITRWRLLREGSFAVRERMQDHYPPTTQIWKVGTGEPNPKFEPRDDEHPEYVADEYLAISQGPSIVSPKGESRGEKKERGGVTVESRVAGRYGTHGWMAREGFIKDEGGTERRRGGAARKPSTSRGDDDAVQVD
ncbi:MAG: VanW family protein [Labilithrix sp.]|nr:VanW family protein [Labilithrix sp.]